MSELRAGVDVLIIDNYDSFTHNLYQGIGELGASVDVVRNDAIDLAGIRALCPGRIVLSPGPGHPQNARDFGVCAQVVRELAAEIPTLGVCLGHQGMAHHHGGSVVRAPYIMHGKTSVIQHTGTGLFAGLPKALEVMRYHSLVVDAASVPDCFEVTARTDDGLIMAIQHRTKPMWGVQFHPESIGTPDGSTLLGNFLNLGAKGGER